MKKLQSLIILIELENYLINLLGLNVDLVTRKGIKPQLRSNILEEVVYLSVKESSFIFLEDIIEAIEAIERFVKQMDLDQFQNDEKTIRAVEREFEIIGEAVKKLSDTITKNYPPIPWKAIADIRDRLIYHYWDTEVETL